MSWLNRNRYLLLILKSYVYHQELQVEAENWLHQVVLWNPHTKHVKFEGVLLCCMCLCTYMQTKIITHFFTVRKRGIIISPLVKLVFVTWVYKWQKTQVLKKEMLWSIVFYWRSLPHYCIRVPTHLLVEQWVKTEQ